jgi:hypothetical protein
MSMSKAEEYGRRARNSDTIEDVGYNVASAVWFRPFLASAAFGSARYEPAGAGQGLCQTAILPLPCRQRPDDGESSWRRSRDQDHRWEQCSCPWACAPCLRHQRVRPAVATALGIATPLPEWNRPLSSEAGDGAISRPRIQWEKNIGTGGRASMLFVAPPRMNSLRRECP